MADKIPYFEKDMVIIGKLGDTPGTDDNLDWRELQAKFDEGGKATKEYLNKVAKILNGLFTSEGGSISGGNLSGDLNVNSNRLYGLPTPKANDDAASKEYADTKLSKTGGTMTGPISMNKNFVQNLPEPVADNDAATKKYVDASVKGIKDSVGVLKNYTVQAEAWVEDENKTYDSYPYRAEIPMSGVQVDGFPEVVFDPGDIEDFDFAPVAVPKNACIYVYCASIPDRAITIPSVVHWGIGT
jgi:hypothetical protein